MSLNLKFSLQLFFRHVAVVIVKFKFLYENLVVIVIIFFQGCVIWCMEMGSLRQGEKSLTLTYVLWFFLGIFGAHHFYLGRDSQAFIWWCTLGGYLGCGWIRDFFYIPRYVAEANNDMKYINEFEKLLKSYGTVSKSFIAQAKC